MASLPSKPADGDGPWTRANCANCRNSCGTPSARRRIKVALDPKDTDQAVVTFGERVLGKIIVDDEDGDRSFSFSMKIPVERPVLQDYLRRLFDNDDLKIVGRA